MKTISRFNIPIQADDDGVVKCGLDVKCMAHEGLGFICPGRTGFLLFDVKKQQKTPA